MIVQMLKIGALTCIILQVAVAIDINPYVERTIGHDVRLCIPYFDCPPGHEIHPCDASYKKEFCVPCKTGMVQPLLVSSNSDLESTQCFKNRNPDKCMAEDVRPSRKLFSSMCEFNNYCECNRDQCNFGDPCVCQRRTTPCGINETMNSTGECVKCPPGTEKKDVGCGPCYHINNSKKYITTPIPNPVNMLAPSLTVATYATTSTKTRYYNSQSNLRTENEVEEDKTSTKEDLTHSSEVHKTNSEPTGSSLVLTVIIVILAVLVIVVGFLLVCLIKRHKAKAVDIANGEGDKLIRNQLNIVDEEAGGNCSHNNKCRSKRDNALRLNSIENNTGKSLNYFNVESSIDLPTIITEIMDTCDCCSKLDDSNNEKNGVHKKIDRDQESTVDDNFQEIRRKDQNNTSDANKSDLSKERGTDGNCKASAAYMPLSVLSITQVTDHNLSPVTQVSDEGPIQCNRDTDESLSSCLEYHNYTVRGETVDSINSTKAKVDSINSTKAKVVSYRSECAGENETDETSNSKTVNSQIPTTVADLSINSTEQSLPYGKSVEKTRGLDNMNNNKESCEDERNKIGRQIDKSEEIMLQAKLCEHDHKDNERQNIRPPSKDTLNGNNGNFKQTKDVMGKIAISMPTSNQSRDSLLADNRQC